MTRKKNMLPEEESSGLMDRLRQQREKLIAEALYHLDGQAQIPLAPVSPVMLPAAPFQVGDIVRTTRELVQQPAGPDAFRLPVSSAGVVQQPAGSGFVSVAFDGQGARIVPVHCLALVEPVTETTAAPADLVLDLVAALAAQMGR